MMKTIEQAIQERHSVRNFTEQEIDTNIVNQINDCIAQGNAQSGLHIQLIVNEPEAFGKSFMARSFMAQYGKFHNVRNYVCLVGPKSDETSLKLGYYGEKVVLLAQQLGLNSCWVGLSYSKRHTHCQIAKGEKLFAVIALGYGVTQGVPHKSKSANEICDGLESAPTWFANAVACALLAPTAINQQKFKFKLLSDGTVESHSGIGAYAKMDLGIARLHFEIGVGREVQWG